MFRTIMRVTIFLSHVQWAFCTDFIIHKGDHYSTPRQVSTFRGPSLKFKARFDESAIYDLGDDKDQLDTSKLYGSSDCFSPHTENSARFGWRWHKTKNELQIIAFTHVNGEFFSEQIGVAKLHAVYDYEIKLSEDKSSYLFIFDGKTLTRPRGCQKKFMEGYKLYPYFGGNEKAPQDIKIKIEDNEDFAHFSLESVYPVPTVDQTIYADLNVMEDLNIGFQVYDVSGRLVQKFLPEFYPGDQEYKRIRLGLNQLRSGVYLIRPYALIDGEEKLGFVDSPGHAFKLLIP
jgi:hypothetical protein